MSPATRLIVDDCLEALRRLPAESVDAVVTDPPYHLTSVVERFGNENAAPLNNRDEREGRNGPYHRASAGFMGQKWDGGDIAFRPETWAEVMRVMKPGAHLLSFGGTRTYHRMACAIEDAGFEIRDTIMWVYGSGFPKSHDVAKGIDKAAGVEGGYGAPKSAAHAGWIERGRMRGEDNAEGWQRPWMQDAEQVGRNARQYEPGTEDARRWQGWGTALKPAVEPICMARKPLAEKTVAANVQRHGTGALHIDASRIGTDAGWSYPNGRGGQGWHGRESLSGNLDEPMKATAGRWPANLLHDGSDEVLKAFLLYGERPGQQGKASSNPDSPRTRKIYGKLERADEPMEPRNDSGSAARFYYAAKASKRDRRGSAHPTVKPVALMAYLCRLVTPPGGTVLDPFAGTGTTGEGAWLGGFNSVLIEREEAYAADIVRRFAEMRAA